MPTDLHRRPLTDLLITNMQTATNKPVGDGRADTRCGWDGQPNSSGTNFRPYYILMPGTAVRSSGPFGDSAADWQLPYVIWSFGIKRNQCEALADLGRDSLSDMEGTQILLAGQKYSIQQVRTEQIGACNRYDATDPPYWGQQDTLTVWVSKEFN